MIKEIAKEIFEFPGLVNQTRCCLHIRNLVAKSILRQFEPPKTKGNDGLTEAARELAALSTDLEHSSLDADVMIDADVDGDSHDEDNSQDVLPDGCESMSEEEIETLEVSVQPVRVISAKVSHFELRNLC